MRQLKFRAYDTRLNKWVATGFAVIGEVTMFGLVDQYVHENAVPSIPTLERYADIEITQWTGMVDCDGVDIYEGDINQDKGIVIWNQDSSSFCWEYETIELMPFEAENEWCIIKSNKYENGIKI